MHRSILLCLTLYFSDPLLILICRVIIHGILWEKKIKNEQRYLGTFDKMKPSVNIWQSNHYVRK